MGATDQLREKAPHPAVTKEHYVHVTMTEVRASPNYDGTPWPGPRGLHAPGESDTRPGGPPTLCVPGVPTAQRPS